MIYAGARDGGRWLPSAASSREFMFGGTPAHSPPAPLSKCSSVTEDEIAGLATMGSTTMAQAILRNTTQALQYLLRYA